MSIQERGSRDDSVRFDVPSRDVQAEDVIQYLLDHEEIDSSSILCVQKTTDGAFEVAFADGSCHDVLLDDPAISVRGIEVVLTKADQQFINVRVQYLPFEVSNTQVSDEMSQFGRVFTCIDVSHPGHPTIKSGVRLLKMTVAEAIPSYVLVAGYQVRVTYRGQTPTCRRCGREGHLANVCSNVQCFRCKEIGHRAADCHVPVKCFKCGKVGHTAWKCSGHAQSQQSVSAESVTDSQMEVIDQLVGVSVPDGDRMVLDDKEKEEKERCVQEQEEKERCAKACEQAEKEKQEQQKEEKQKKNVQREKPSVPSSGTGSDGSIADESSVPDLWEDQMVLAEQKKAELKKSKETELKHAKQEKWDEMEKQRLRQEKEQREKLAYENRCKRREAEAKEARDKIEAEKVKHEELKKKEEFFNRDATLIPVHRVSKLPNDVLGWRLLRNVAVIHSSWRMEETKRAQFVCPGRAAFQVLFSTGLAMVFESGQFTHVWAKTDDFAAFRLPRQVKQVKQGQVSPDTKS